MENEARTNKENVEIPLHSLFVDLSAENDLKGEELEWFRSRIHIKKPHKKKKDKRDAVVHKKVEIVRGEDLKNRNESTNKLLIKLEETNTIWLLTLDTLYSSEDVADIERVCKQNAAYEMKKNKIEIIRKRCMADAQTPRYMEKSRGTMTAEIKKTDCGVSASDWDLFDTYNAFDEGELTSLIKFLTSSDSTKTFDNSSDKVEDDDVLPKKSKIAKILESLNFKYAALVTERLLASNCYQEEQTIFKTQFVSRYDEYPTSFTYQITPLWSFRKDLKPSLMVTDLDWNPLNQDLLAVGYGDLNFLKITSGLVCIWSSKNPRQPEREFPIEESVTALHYSKIRPNILAVGTKRGKIYILDVSSYSGSIQLLKSIESKPRPDPVWKVEWFQHRELISESEELLVVGESGILMLFSFSTEEAAKNVLKLDYVVSREKALEKKSLKKNLSYQQADGDSNYDKKTFSGLCFSILSDRNFCYISTKEGVLVKCNLRNPSMMDGIFLAHEGPIYTIAHSPVTDLIYFTCGADWNIRIWMEGILQPLLTLQTKAPVRCARWSPTIPTIIASIGDAEFSLWDISRNVLFPMSVKNFEDTGKPFSTLLFSPNGTNVIIGGEDGLARVVHLSQLPRIPFLQIEALIAAIRNGLYRNKALIPTFERMVETNKLRLTTGVELS